MLLMLMVSIVVAAILFGVWYVQCVKEISAVNKEIEKARGYLETP